MKLDIEAELKRMHEWIENRGETSIDVRYVEALTRLKRIGILAGELSGPNAPSELSEILRLCGVEDGKCSPKE